MATFEIESGGKTFEVEAPDMESAVRAFKKFQAEAAGRDAPPTDGPAPEADQPAKVKQGRLLPISHYDTDEPGLFGQPGLRFDPDAGIVGAIKAPFEFTTRVMQGEASPTGDEAIREMANAAMLFTPMNPGVRAGDRVIPGIARAGRSRPAPVPTAHEIDAAGSAGFDAVRAMDVRYTTESVNKLADVAIAELTRDGFGPRVAKTTHKLLRELAKRPKEPGSFADTNGLISFRRNLANAAKAKNKTERAAATQTIRRLDDFLQNPDPGSVVSGPAGAAAKTYAEANANYSAAKRSEDLTGLDQRATRRAAASNSGLNIDNTIRQRVSSLLENENARRGFTAEEIALLEQVAKGTAPRNLTRFIGKVLGGGGGLGALVTGGTVGGGISLSTGNPAAFIGGVTGPAAGLIATAAGNRATRNALRGVAEKTRARAPLAAQQRQLPMKPPSAGVRSAVPRALGAAGAAGTPTWTWEEYQEYLRSGGA